MISGERILKLDIMRSTGEKILTAENNEFSIAPNINSITGRTETMLIVKGNDVPQIPSGSETEVIAYMRSGERIKYPAFVSLSTKYQLNIVMRIARAVIMEERRRYFKVQANIDCIITSIERDGKRIVLQKPAIAKIKDLNIGGIFLCICEEDLFKNDILIINIKLDDKLVEVNAEIIRLQRNEYGDPSGYGCRFINVTPSLEETFAKFVFKVQLESIKNDERSKFKK